MPGSRLIHRIQETTARFGCTAVGVAIYDYESTIQFSYHGDRMFHAASTIKVAILLALFRAVDQGKIKLEGRLQVRNRFRSVVGGAVYRVDCRRDGDAELHRWRGHALPISDLARAMIVRSSNLATNLICEYLGMDYIRAVLEEAGLSGIKIERGVEDEAAFQQGRNNEVSADGQLHLFRLLCENRFLTPGSCDRVLEILLAQEFNQMIPKKLPEGSRVAHKTGEISTVSHDAGIVYLPNRKPYVIAILTESPPGQGDRPKAVAAISGAVLNYLSDINKRDE